jgi:hypothetical protein
LKEKLIALASCAANGFAEMELGRERERERGRERESVCVTNIR